jgi:hypothetical protein
MLMVEGDLYDIKVECTFSDDARAVIKLFVRSIVCCCSSNSCCGIVVCCDVGGDNGSCQDRMLPGLIYLKILARKLWDIEASPLCH